MIDEKYVTGVLLNGPPNLFLDLLILKDEGLGLRVALIEELLKGESCKC